MKDYDAFMEVVDSMDTPIEGERKRFVIENDQQAEWAMNIIHAEQEEANRRTAICDAEIMRYESIKDGIRSKAERKVSGLKSMLIEYFGTVDHKRTKTKESYSLASGTMVMKHKEPKPVRDDAVLTEWLNENAPEYVKMEVSMKPMWGDLKKTLTVSGSDYLTADGQIVEGVQAVAQEDEFLLEFN